MGALLKLAAKLTVACVDNEGVVTHQTRQTSVCCLRPQDRD